MTGFCFRILALSFSVASTVVLGGRVLEPLPTSAVPQRSEDVRKVARACVANHGENHARVYFLHNRKAGVRSTPPYPTLTASRPL